MQRKQVLVKISNENEGNYFIQHLEKEGFLNVHNITFDKLRTKVLVIDRKKFFQINVTCLAALASCGIKPISVDEFIDQTKSQSNVINSL